MSTFALYGSLASNNGTDQLNSSNYTQNIIQKSDEIKKNHLNFIISIDKTTVTPKSVPKKTPKAPKE